MQAEDLFVQDLDGKDLEVPAPERNLKKSQCTPLFMCAYRSKHNIFVQFISVTWCQYDQNFNF